MVYVPLGFLSIRSYPPLKRKEETSLYVRSEPLFKKLFKEEFGLGTGLLLFRGGVIASFSPTQSHFPPFPWRFSLEFPSQGVALLIGRGSSFGSTPTPGGSFLFSLLPFSSFGLKASPRGSRSLTPVPRPRREISPPPF